MIMCDPDAWTNVHQQPGNGIEPVQVWTPGQILLFAARRRRHWPGTHVQSGLSFVQATVVRAKPRS